MVSQSAFILLILIKSRTQLHNAIKNIVCLLKVEPLTKLTLLIIHISIITFHYFYFTYFPGKKEKKRFIDSKTTLQPKSVDGEDMNVKV